MSNSEGKRKLSIITKVVIGIALCIGAGAAWTAWRTYNEYQNRKASFVNLRWIGLALANRESTYRSLPTSENMFENSPHPYSWRVAILPFIEQASLYNEYRFDEPWDSESNKKVLQQMPSVFRHPLAPKDTTTTSVVMSTGTGTAFPGNKPVKLSDITDGTSDTIFVVESKSNIPWTKPEDLKLSPDADFKSIGGFYSNCFFAVFGDGEVKCIQHSDGKDKIWAMFTANGTLGDRLSEFRN